MGGGGGGIEPPFKLWLLAGKRALYDHLGFSYLWTFPPPCYNLRYAVVRHT